MNNLEKEYIPVEFGFAGGVSPLKAVQNLNNLGWAVIDIKQADNGDLIIRAIKLKINEDARRK